ncbi:MAG: hypothetical protein M0Z77_00855 [Thermoplasmatales archaeon]|nr:hypothetical protein [Thermoplasmatales archaeon]
MPPFALSPGNSADLEFSVEKFDYNLYGINSTKSDVKGILRIAVVPTNIYLLKEKVNNKPQFYMQSANLISFVNQGIYGRPDSSLVDFAHIEKYDSFELEEGKDYESLNEPGNTYFIIGTTPMYRIRVKSTVVKIELIKGHYDFRGNPIFSVEVNPGISYSYMAKITERVQ